jgi:hypothetical protein
VCFHVDQGQLGPIKGRMDADRRQIAEIDGLEKRLAELTKEKGKPATS